MNCSYATSLAATRSFLLVRSLTVSAPLARLTDPTNRLTVVNLTAAPFGGETLQTNLIMPGPYPFLSRDLPLCSIIRPTETNGIAMGVVQSLTAMGLFAGQSQAFFD